MREHMMWLKPEKKRARARERENAEASKKRGQTKHTCHARHAAEHRRGPHQRIDTRRDAVRDGQTLGKDAPVAV